MSDAFFIRAAEPADSAEIARLCRELGYPAASDEIERRLHQLRGMDDRFVGVAPGDDGSLLGWVVVEHRIALASAPAAAIIGMVVDAASRRHGVGRALLAAAEQWAAARGLARITVVSNVNRRESHAFYRGLGFAHAKTQHAYVKRLR